MNLRILIPVMLFIFGVSLCSGKLLAQSDLIYAYVSVYGKAMRNSGETIEKMDIAVDLGNLASQQQMAEGYAFKMKDFQSYAAVLNFMANKGFRLVDTIQFEKSINGTGGTTGVHFIFEKVQTE